MVDFNIIIDSTIDLPKELIIKEQIDVIPVEVIIGDKTFDDGTIHPSELTEYVSNGIIPKTTQPSPDKFHNLYQRKLTEQKPILSIHISSELSGTYNSANLAAKDLNNITLFDTQNASIGSSYFVILAIFLRSRGYSINESINILELAKNDVKLQVLIDDVRYLNQSGRINLLTFKILNIFKIRPIITCQDGLLVKNGVAFGLNRGKQKIVNRINQYLSGEDSYTIFGSTGNTQELKTIVNMTKGLNVNNHDLVNIGTALQVHTGPNALGIAKGPAFHKFIT